MVAIPTEMIVRIRSLHLHEAGWIALETATPCICRDKVPAGSMRREHLGFGMGVFVD